MLMFSISVIGCQSASLRPQHAQGIDRTSLSSAQVTSLSSAQGTSAQALAELGVAADAPVGWTIRTVSEDARHTHLVWESPSGATAFGVIAFKMPWPVGHEAAFKYGFIASMRRAEGEANVLTKNWTDDRSELRADVEGGKFLVRMRFIVRGVRGWSIYAGTLRSQPINEEELKLAESSRNAASISSTASSDDQPSDDLGDADSTVPRSLDSSD